MEVALIVCAINLKKFPRGAVGISVRINYISLTCIVSPYRLFLVVLRYSNNVTAVKP